MRKALLVIGTIIITASAYAQTDSTDRKRNPSDNKYHSDFENQNHPDGVMYQNGEMLMVKNGKITRLEKDITLNNGTIIMSNGIYMKKGGTRKMFNEGEHMDMSGRIVRRDNTRNIHENEK